MKTKFLIPIVLFFSIPLFSQNTRLYFDFDSYALSDGSKKVLNDKLPDYRLSDSVEIVGYADTSGMDSYNMVLSKKRAEAIQKWFIDNKIESYVKASWKGETEVINPYSGHDSRRAEVFAFSKGFEFPEKVQQVFYINNLKDTIILGKEGTLIKIPANSIIIAKGQGNNRLFISLTEYYTASDILLNNLSTRTKTDLLQTNGMINLRVYQNKEVCSIRADKPIQIGFPVNGTRNNEMRLFQGKPDHNIEVIWQESESPFQTSPPGLMQVEEMPTFQGGDIYDFMAYTCKYLVYPQIAIDSQICGRVIIGFAVDENGLISNARILRGAHSSLNSEALRAVNNSPPWVPGKQGNKNVKVQFVIPINFRMDDGCNYKIDSLGMAGGSYARFTDSTFKDLTVNEINYYIFETLSLGWLNCDQYPFMNKSKLNLNVRIEKPGEISTHIMFTNYNSYLRGDNRKGVFYFNQLPKNEAVILLAIQKLGSKIYWAHKKIKTNSETESLEDFDEITFDDLNVNIDKLRKELR
jgi:TonB family protein